MQWITISAQIRSKERELEVAVAQEKVRLRLDVVRELLKDRDSSAREAATGAARVISAADNLMHTEEHAWQSAKFAPEDEKEVAEYVAKLREEYNNAAAAWDGTKNSFSPLLVGYDPDDKVPRTWARARAATDALQRCIDTTFTVPTAVAPDVHPCRRTASAAHELLSAMTQSVAAAKLRVVSAVQQYDFSSD